MSCVTGLKVLNLTNGGPANSGNDIYFELSLFNGDQEFNQLFFMPQERISVLLMALSHFAGAAKTVRLSESSRYATPVDCMPAYAFDLRNAIAASALTDPTVALFKLQIGAGEGRLMDLYLAADRRAVRKLHGACGSALARFETAKLPGPDGLH